MILIGYTKRITYCAYSAIKIEDRNSFIILKKKLNFYCFTADEKYVKTHWNYAFKKNFCKIKLN